MDYEKFTALCNTLGNQSLPAGERWKSLKHIHSTGQATPIVDVQAALISNKIKFINDVNVGPGFLIVQNPVNDFVVDTSGDVLITFISLKNICGVTFVPRDDIQNATELLRIVTPGTYDTPVAIKFTHSIYYFKKGQTITIPIYMSEQLEPNNYDITYKNAEGNIIDSISDVGRYQFIVTCKNGYVGTGRTFIEVQPV